MVRAERETKLTELLLPVPFTSPPLLLLIDMPNLACAVCHRPAGPCCRNLFKNVLRAREAEREDAALRVLEAKWMAEEVNDMGQEDIRSHAMRCASTTPKGSLLD